MIVEDFAADELPPALPANRTLDRFLASAAAAIPVHGAVSVLLTSDRRMRSLNRQYRNKNESTDVLSFPAVQLGVGKGRAVAGDLAISVHTAARQAIALEHTLAVELRVLILHGLLHLAGFDHENDKGEMAAREMELRRRFRLPGGLIERTESAGVKPLHAKPKSSPRSPEAKQGRSIQKNSARKITRA